MVGLFSFNRAKCLESNSYQMETPLEMVMNAEMISYPNTKLMCSVNVDGAAAAVLASGKKVRELGLGKRAIKVRASALTSDPWQERDLVMPFPIGGTTRWTSCSARWTTASPRPSTSPSRELQAASRA